jgi:hypothetical protein
VSVELVILATALQRAAVVGFVVQHMVFDHLVQAVTGKRLPDNAAVEWLHHFQAQQHLLALVSLFLPFFCVVCMVRTIYVGTFGIVNSPQSGKSYFHLQCCRTAVSICYLPAASIIVPLVQQRLVQTVGSMSSNMLYVWCCEGHNTISVATLQPPENFGAICLEEPWIRVWRACCTLHCSPYLTQCSKGRTVTAVLGFSVSRYPETAAYLQARMLFMSLSGTCCSGALQNQVQAMQYRADVQTMQFRARMQAALDCIIQPMCRHCITDAVQSQCAGNAVQSSYAGCIGLHHTANVQALHR